MEPQVTGELLCWYKHLRLKRQLISININCQWCWLTSVDLFLTWTADETKTDLSFQYFRVHAVIGLEYLLGFLLSSKITKKTCSYIFKIYSAVKKKKPHILTGWAASSAGKSHVRSFQLVGRTYWLWQAASGSGSGERHHIWARSLFKINLNLSLLQRRQIVL